MTEHKGRAKGGYATAAKMTAEELKERAMKGVEKRKENAELPVALHEGEFPIGDSLIACAHLPNGQRIITQATFLRALGRSRSPKAGTGVLSTLDALPFFLQANVLQPYISAEVADASRPIFYKSKKGTRNVGYDATLLPKVAEVYLKLRDDSLAKTGEVPRQYEHIINAADILMRGLAHVGIIALVDEATGYQDVRARNELNVILQAYIAKELLPWTKRFPDEFYKQIFRLHNWPFNPMSVKRPGYVGTLTNKLVYERLPDGVLDELKKRNPPNEAGNRKYRHHQLLTENVGHPHLEKHVASVTTLMRACDSWQMFETLFLKAFPISGDQGKLFSDEGE
ncbi:hypothetical protein GMLC_22710 [Geomonas limicola]|uniref:Bacteriophage Mx8 p63 C-terminal domain-containing protein n=1 Tax=Geomonas limicola TaxID=2740186 RepID=A0A6V8N7Y8_9BACT|nr:P63C domain-containing protein [Geomonas limicola]GFO68692.1 hypothetical protein GMLC_22710 [Geomonas limicola]